MSNSNPLSVLSGDRELQVEVSVNPENAALVAISIFLALVIGIAVGAMIFKKINS
jgi:hypothetical protein